MSVKNSVKTPLVFFIGPCVLESMDLATEVAQRLVEDLREFGGDVTLAFKGSFDKANRSSYHSYRGPGIEKGLQILERIKKEYHLPVLTDFHLPSQAQEVASVVDILQVPAFLCRQTDMVVEGAMACQKWGRELKIKKGQFLSPYEAKNIVDKVSPFLDKNKIYLTERGVSFGYNNLIVDMSSFQVMKSFGVRTVHDATHCVQLPGGLGQATGGRRENIVVLARAAVAAGADGVFMETHPHPEQALSDAATSLPLGEIKGIVKKLLAIYKVVSIDSMDEGREELS